jgi:ribokinase
MLCIGKAGQDTFLEGEVFKPLKDKGVFYEHIKLGEKFYVENATFSTGGNAPNAAVTFARQHLHTKFVGVLGDDPAGHSIINALDAEHIDTTAVVIDESLRTSFSTIMLAPTGERTILDYPGTAKLKEEHVDVENLDADWLYISSVGSMPLLKKIMKAAHAQGISIAFNPASFELKHLQECADLLTYVTLFAVNKEEAQLFVEGASVKILAKKLVESIKYVLVSDGAKGSVASDGLSLISAGMYEDVPVKDRTGAGDAFTSGFVSQIALGKSLEHAITFASANSTSVVTQIGAKTGILHSGSRIHEMDLLVESI